MGNEGSWSAENAALERQYLRAPEPKDSQAQGISTEEEFAQAVHNALRDFSRPDRLRSNALIGSRLVVAALERSSVPPVSALRNLIRIHCEQLGQNGKYARHRQILELTYLAPLRRQRAVADALHLSWSTYRRYLKDATHILTAALWEAECALQVIPPHRKTVHAARFWPWLAVPTVLVLLVIAGFTYLPRHAHRRKERNPSSLATVITAASDNGYVQNVSGTWDFYSVGMEYLNVRTEPNIRRAIGSFQKSIKADPGNANAWAALAKAYAVWHDYSPSQPPDTHYNEALSATNKALALNPALPTAHAVLGLLHTEHWEWQEAREEYQLALRLDPYNADTHRWYARYFWLTGDTREALVQMQAADDLDPVSPVASAELGRALAYTEALNEAEARLRTGITLAPRFALNYEYLAETHLAMKKYTQVLNDAKTAQVLNSESSDPFLLMESGLAEVRLGHKDIAKRYLAALQQQASTRYVSAVLIAGLYWSLGDNKRSFAELQRAAQDHDDNLAMTSGPDWAEIRRDPRFMAIRKAMSLPPAGNPASAKIVSTQFQP